MKNHKRDWNKYIKTQKAQECQLITALNISYYLTGEIVKLSSNRYEEFVELSGAIAGTCISIGDVYDELGLYIMKYFKNDYRLDESGVPLPLGASVFLYEEKFGSHSVAIIDYDEKNNCFRIPNWEKFTTDGWISRYKFNKLSDYMNKDGTVGGRNPDIKYSLFGI